MTNHHAPPQEDQRKGKTTTNPWYHSTHSSWRLPWDSKESRGTLDLKNQKLQPADGNRLRKPQPRYNRGESHQRLSNFSRAAKPWRSSTRDNKIFRQRSDSRTVNVHREAKLSSSLTETTMYAPDHRRIWTWGDIWYIWIWFLFFSEQSIILLNHFLYFKGKIENTLAYLIPKKHKSHLINGLRKEANHKN